MTWKNLHKRQAGVNYTLLLRSNDGYSHTSADLVDVRVEMFDPPRIYLLSLGSEVKKWRLNKPAQKGAVKTPATWLCNRIIPESGTGFINSAKRSTICPLSRKGHLVSFL